jgi:hypothetical protein
MSPRHAEVIPTQTRNVTHAGSTDVRSTESADMGRGETADMGSAEATHVTSAEAAHVAATKAATVSSAATAAGVRARGNKAAGKQRSCQNHHPSSFHDLSPLQWAGIPPQEPRQTLARPNKANADAAIGSKMGILVRRPY